MAAGSDSGGTAPPSRTGRAGEERSRPGLMCGIAGILRPRADPGDRDAVAAMLAELVRRGPDDSGIEQHQGATLGNRRLAILDLSPAGHQPMVSASGRFVVVLNGEIYNFRELRDELGLDPSQLRSSSDTEILLWAWERWGEEAPTRLVGQFAFALWDTREQVLWLVRDRFGEKPLYWHQSGGSLAFASSLGALVQAPFVPRAVCPSAAAELVALRYVVAPRTVLQDCRKVPGGHLVRVDRDGVVERAWWQPRFTARARSRSEADEEFATLLDRASRRCLVSDVPVALFLSDGIDSHSILAALTEARSDLPTYTYRMPDAESPIDWIPERPETHDVVVGPDERMDGLRRACEGFTEPVGDGAALATWLLLKHCREGATVFLCGHGADEVLGGYRITQDRFRLAFMHRMSGVPLRYSSRAYERFMFGAESPADKRGALRAGSVRLAPQAARYLIHRPLPWDQVSAICGREVDDYLASIDRLYAACGPEVADVDRILYVMMKTFLEANILTYADSVAGDWSAELRMPFLDRDLVEFVFSLPAAWRLGRWPGRANTKLPLRRWARRHLPSDIVTRKKRGFNYGHMSTMVRSRREEILGYVRDSAAVRRVLPGAEAWIDHPPEHFGGYREGPMWAMVSLGIWAERYAIT